jgi:hypothetical protein
MNEDPSCLSRLIVALPLPIVAPTAILAKTIVERLQSLIDNETISSIRREVVCARLH